MTNKIDNIEQNLMNQVIKLIKGTNQKSIKTRYRYLAATKRFCRFLAQEYRSQKFSNIQTKRIFAYVNKLTENGLAVSTIKADLSGIRFFHNLSGDKNKLIDNKHIIFNNKPKTCFDRAWLPSEIKDAVAYANEPGNIKVTLAIEISAKFGLRVEEVAKIRVAQIKDAISNLELEVKGKGGQVRYIPVYTMEQQHLLKTVEKYIDNKNLNKNDFLLVDNIKGGVQNMKKTLQNFVYNHRKKFQDPNRNTKIIDGQKRKSPNLTFHGLRYYYAQSRFKIEEKNNPKNAKKIVSENLGHHRKEITNVYLKEK